MNARALPRKRSRPATALVQPTVPSGQDRADGHGAAGAVVALDLGARRIGVARCDSARRLAFPYGVLERSGDVDADLRAMAGLVVELRASAVVVGLPLSLSGRRGPEARRAAAEAERLDAALRPNGISVELFDERFTTRSAEAALREAGSSPRQGRRVPVDAAAATVLLQSWLDREALA